MNGQTLPEQKQSPANVSVVVPSYNHANFVEQALRSIFAQSLAPLELIVIDDGSSDSSAAVIEKTLKDCPFPSEFHVRENRGLSRTLNQALDMTKGEYFAYLGSDDVWLPDFLMHRLETLARKPDAVLASGQLHAIDANNEIIGVPFVFEHYRHLNTRDRLLYGFAPTSSGIVYRKRFLLNDRWNPNIKLEDYDLYLRLCMKGEFLFDERFDAAWRLHETNTSSRYEFMMSELTDAIERNADVLRLSEPELRSAVSTKRAAYIDKYLADHHRREAIKIFVNNLKGFPSKFAIIKKAIKLLTPFTINDRRTARILDQMTKASNTYINENFEIVPVIKAARKNGRAAIPKKHFG